MMIACVSTMRHQQVKGGVVEVLERMLPEAMHRRAKVGDSPLGRRLGQFHLNLPDERRMRILKALDASLGPPCAQVCVCACGGAHLCLKRLRSSQSTRSLTAIPAFVALAAPYGDSYDAR